jgi:hypothetical protein
LQRASPVRTQGVDSGPTEAHAPRAARGLGSQQMGATLAETADPASPEPGSAAARGWENTAPRCNRDISPVNYDHASTPQEPPKEKILLITCRLNTYSGGPGAADVQLGGSNGLAILDSK